MAEQLSQERFNAFQSSVSNQYEEPIPDTDASDAMLSNENEVTISETSSDESDEHSEFDRIQSPNDGNDDDYIEETDLSESDISQPEVVANNDDVINIPATPSQSDHEEDLFENDSPVMMNNDSMVNSLLINSNEISISHSNLSSINLSPIRSNSNDENVISESDGSQRSLSQFVIDREISIPETPSQSESEQDPIETNQSHELNTSQIANNSQRSIENAPAVFSITLSQLEDDVVNVVANTEMLNDEPRSRAISPDIFEDSDDFIPNSVNFAESYIVHHTPPTIVSPDIFDDFEDPVDEPMESQNANEISPIVVHDFPFIVPGKFKS